MAGVKRVGLVGGRGYVGEELLKLLLPHPGYDVSFMVSRSLAGQPLAEVFPKLALLPGADQLSFAAMTADDVARADCDVVVLARSNGEAAAFVEALDASGSAAGILDISADYRFDAGWVYGLPEVNKGHIAGARRVSNPGCYATATQLGLLPLLDVLADTPLAFGVSGFSGAGRTPSERNNPERLADNLLPYKLSGHLHEAEISHQLKTRVSFMPHVAAFFRGISVTLAATLQQPMSPQELHKRFSACYQAFPLVSVLERIPEIADVRDQPTAAIGGFSIDEGYPQQVRWVSCIDNLLKGAASQALENLNLMMGLDHTAGIGS